MVRVPLGGLVNDDGKAVLVHAGHVEALAACGDWLDGGLVAMCS